MVSLCAGSSGKMDEADRMMKVVPSLVKKKTNQIEAFVSRRAQVLSSRYRLDCLAESFDIRADGRGNGGNIWCPYDIIN